MESCKSPAASRARRKTSEIAAAAMMARMKLPDIEETPNDGKFEIDLHGDLAGILTVAAHKDRPLEASDPSVQQVKLVAGAGFSLWRTEPKLIAA